MSALIHPRRFSASLALVLTAALLFALAGCDTGAPADPSETPGASSPMQGASDTDSLLLVPAPPGASLLPLSGEGEQSSDGDASPYGCTISTLRSAENVAAGKERYRYDSVFLHFPAGLLQRADGAQYATFVLGSQYASAHAQSAEEIELGERQRVDGGVVRLARCRLPAGGEVTGEARAMMRERLEQVSEPDRWIADRAAGGEEGQNGYECVEWVTTQICVPNYGCGDLEIECLEWEYVQSDDPLGGGDDGGNNGGGDDSNSCEDNGDGTFDDLCFDGGGGGPGGGGGNVIPQPKDYSTEVDTVEIENLPDCSDPNGADQLGPSDISEKAWRDYCESSLPITPQEDRINDALDRIEARGGVCVDIAQRGRLYLNNDLIRLYPSDDRAGGYGYTGLVLIWDDYVDLFYDLSYTKEDAGWVNDGYLDSILAHEFDHVIGNPGHIGDTFFTEHEQQCSGL